MDVYQVVFEEIDISGVIKDIIEYVMSGSLLAVANKMDERAKQMGWSLILTVVERIEG